MRRNAEWWNRPIVPLQTRANLSRHVQTWRHRASRRHRKMTRQRGERLCFCHLVKTFVSDQKCHFAPMVQKYTYSFENRGVLLLLSLHPLTRKQAKNEGMPVKYRFSTKGSNACAS